MARWSHNHVTVRYYLDGNLCMKVLTAQLGVPTEGKLDESKLISHFNYYKIQVMSRVSTARTH